MGDHVADNIFHAILGTTPKTPTPVGNIGGGGGYRPPTPTPIAPVPGFNPMGKKKPTTPTVIPGGPGFTGLRPPGSPGRTLLGS